MFKKVRRLFHGRKRVLITWIVSYAIIMALPILSWSVVQHVANQIILDQTNALHRGMLNVISSSVDHLVGNIETTLAVIGVDSGVLERLNSPLVSSPQERYENSRLSDFLQNHVSREGAIRSIYIYFFDQDYVISELTATTAPIFFAAELAPVYSLSFDEWKTMMLQNHQKDYVVLETKNGGRSVAVLLTLPAAGLNASSGNQATLMILLQPGALTDIINQIDPDDRIVTSIQREDGLLLAQTGAPADQDYLLTEITGSDTGWRYSAQVFSSAFLDQSAYIRRLAWVGIFLTSLLCAFIIWFSVRQNYNPLQRLVSHLEQRLQRDTREPGENEYAYLQHSFDDMMESNQLNSVFIQNQTEKLHRIYVSQLLLGYAEQNGYTQDYLNALGFDVSTRFAVLLSELDSCQTPENLSSLMLTGEQEDCLLFGRCTSLDGQAALLVDCSDWDSEAFSSILKQIYFSARETSPSLRVACSKIHSGADGIPSAFNEAQYALDYFSAIESPGILFYEEISSGKNNTLFYPAAEEQRLIAAVKSGDADGAEQIFNHIWEKNQFHGKMDLDSSYLLRTGILSTMLKVNAEASHHGGRIPVDLSILRRQPHNAEKIRAELLGVLRQACLAAKEVFRHSDEGLKNQIISYIFQNYSDPSLSVESVCAQFRRSPSGIAKLFRETTGDGLLYQINFIRIEKAKAMLAKNTQTVNETALAVGYTNTNTFVRLFKKYEGITPGRYREIVSSIQALRQEENG